MTLHKDDVAEPRLPLVAAVAAANTTNYEECLSCQ
jgi:hypothetical protein